MSNARNIEIKVRLHEEELAMIRNQMAKIGTDNRENYIRRMATEGFIKTIDTSEIRRMNTLLSRYGNNLNQIARRLNATGRLYDVDMQDIVTQFRSLVEQVKTMEFRLLEEAA